ncbi:MAG: hypothetical protein H7X99_01150, partial [Saprospiraceae bacterium]|nr:hypothetical protein [Saprospiraceae bacterium]
GRSIQRNYENRNSYENDFGDRLQHGDFFESDSILTKNQSIHYTKVLNRKVTSYGGITPDIFIGLDSAYRNVQLLNAKSYISEFVYRFVSENKESMPSNIKILSDWEIPIRFYKSFSEFLESESPDNKINSEQLVYLSDEIKQNISMLLFGKDNADNYFMHNDDFIKKAIQIIRNKSTLKEILTPAHPDL